MLHFIDQTSEGDHHMVFNAAIISVLLTIYPEERLTAHGIASNHKSVQELLTPKELERIVFYEIRYTKPVHQSLPFKAFNYLKKELRRKSHFKSLLKSCTAKDLLFLSTTTFTSFYFFKKLSRHFHVPTIAALHGNIIAMGGKKSMVGRLNVYMNKEIFKLKIPHFKYLVLNKISKHYLLESGYFDADEVLDINHPFAFLDPEVRNKDIRDSHPVKIGHIGSMEERKGSQYIYEVAAVLRQQIEEQKLQFRVVGLMTPGILPYKNEWVEELVGNSEPDKPQYLSRTQYEQELKLLDYCVFFYPQDEYVFRASGAAIDFITNLIPIITLPHPYFNYLFETGGNIGFICKDMKEVESLLKKIADKDPAILGQYAEQQQHIKVLQDHFSVDTVAQDLKKQMASLV